MFVASRRHFSIIFGRLGGETKYNVDKIRESRSKNGKPQPRITGHTNKRYGTFFDILKFLFRLKIQGYKLHRLWQILFSPWMTSMFVRRSEIVILQLLYNIFQPLKYTDENNDAFGFFFFFIVNFAHYIDTKKLWFLYNTSGNNNCVYSLIVCIQTNFVSVFG